MRNMFGKKNHREKALHEFSLGEQEMDKEPPQLMTAYNYFLKATQHDPNEVMYWYRLGKCQTLLAHNLSQRIRIGGATGILQKSIRHLINSDMVNLDPIHLRNGAIQSFRNADAISEQTYSVTQLVHPRSYKIKTFLGLLLLEFAKDATELNELNNFVESKNYLEKALEIAPRENSKYTIRDDSILFMIYDGLVQIGIHQMYQLAYNGFVKWNEMGQMDGSRIMFSGNVEKIKSLFADTCNYWRELLVFCPDNEFEHYSKGLSSFEKDWISKFEEK